MFWGLTQVEVVVLSVSDDEQEDNGVDDSYAATVSVQNIIKVSGGEAAASVERTLGRWVLAEVLGLVAAQNTGGLDLGGGASGKLLVEVDDALHRNAVGVGAKGLYIAIISLVNPPAVKVGRSPVTRVLLLPSSPKLLLFRLRRAPLGLQESPVIILFERRLN